MLIDTHAHVNFHAFKDDAKEVLQRALDSGVQVVTVGSQIDTSSNGVELANMFESGIYAAVGLHPEHTYSQVVDEEGDHFRSREEVFNYEEYKKLAQNPKVVGIGECGLDYYRMPEGIDPQIVKAKQQAAFRAQIKLAKELDKALVVHSRPAKDNNELYDDMLEILDEELTPTTPAAVAATPPRIESGAGSLQEGSTAAAVSPPGTGGVPSAAGGGGRDLRFEIHSFTGSPEYLQKFLDRGAYVSFNGIITFDKTGNMEKLVQMTPLDRIILETDCPYLTPVPYRGKRNEPSYVRFVAEAVAKLKGLSVSEVENLTSLNATCLFSLDQYSRG